MTTSSDEQWRIQKATNGKNGVNKQDSVDEEIDNSIDENAKNIEAKFENGILREIYNDGAPMNSNDRSNSLTLDGRSKSTKQNKKGKYGIGGFYSRCMLAGQGKQIITTKDGDDIYTCEIDLEKLQDKEYCPAPNCWTGDHKYRPKWEKVDPDLFSNYRPGVTKEYIGDKITTKFTLEDVVLHLVKKYNKNIKNGLKIMIRWDGKRYLLPDIYNYTIKPYSIDVYNNNNGLVDYYAEYNSKTIKCSPKRLTPNYKGQKEGTRIGSYFLIVVYPKNMDINLSSDEYDTDAKKMGYITTQYINNNIKRVLKNICKNNEIIEINCGENSVQYPIIENKSDINNDVETQMNLFVPEITISMDNNTLCYIEFNRKLAMSKGGDMAQKKIHPIFSVDLKFNSSEIELDLSQEDKNKVQLPIHLSKIISKIIDLIQQDINNKLRDNYNELEKQHENENESEHTESENENEHTESDNENKNEHTESDNENKNEHTESVNENKNESEHTESDNENKNESEHTDSDNENKNESEHTESVNENTTEHTESVNENKSIKVREHYKGTYTKEKADKIFTDYKNQFKDNSVAAGPLNAILNYEPK